MQVSAVTAGNFEHALGRMVQDPEIFSIELLAAPAGSEVAQLRGCLKRAPHVRKCILAHAHAGLELWLDALPLQITRDFGAKFECDDFQSLAQTRNVRFKGAKESAISAIESCTRLTHLAWSLAYVESTHSGDEEPLVCRLFRTASLTSLNLSVSWLSLDTLTLLGATIAQSESLVFLELHDKEAAPVEALEQSLAVVWTQLRDSPVCTLQRLVVDGHAQSFAGLEQLLATSQARTHLVALKLVGFSQYDAVRLLPVIADNCTALVVLDLSLVARAETKLVRSQQVLDVRAAALEIDGLASANSGGNLSRCGLEISEGDHHYKAEEQVLFESFLGLIAKSSPQLHTLSTRSSAVARRAQH